MSMIHEMCNCGRAYMSIIPPPPCPMHHGRETFPPAYADCTTPAPTVGDLERRIAELERRLAEQGK